MPQIDGERDAAPADKRGGSLIRDSFHGINERFHLAGIYTLIDILGAITATALSEDPEWVGLLMLTWMVRLGIEFAIYGVVYHAAARTPGKPSFLNYGAILFLPLFWLQLRLSLLIYAPMLLGLLTYHEAASIGTDLQEWIASTMFWLQPLTTLAIMLLYLYSIPLCIHNRITGRRGNPIRDGLKLLRENRSDSRRLLVLVLSICALAATAHFMHGPATTDLVPSLPEAMILLATAYLILVLFFAATRVVLAQPSPEKPGNTTSGDPPRTGPEGS